MLEKERLITIGKLLVALATVWAIAASLYIFFAPVTIHSVTATTVSGGLDTVEESTSELSWYKVQGLWGSIVLLLFAGLYGLAARLAWRAAYLPLGILSVLALALTYLAGFSIGLAYLPAAIGLFIGALLLVLPQFPMPWNQPGL